MSEPIFSCSSVRHLHLGSRDRATGGRVAVEIRHEQVHLRRECALVAGDAQYRRTGGSRLQPDSGVGGATDGDRSLEQGRGHRRHTGTGGQLGHLDAGGLIAVVVDDGRAQRQCGVLLGRRRRVRDVDRQLPENRRQELGGGRRLTLGAGVVHGRVTQGQRGELAAVVAAVVDGNVVARDREVHRPVGHGQAVERYRQRDAALVRGRDLHPLDHTGVGPDLEPPLPEVHWGREASGEPAGLKPVRHRESDGHGRGVRHELQVGGASQLGERN